MILLSSTQIQSTLLFFVFCYISISYLFKDTLDTSYYFSPDSIDGSAVDKSSKRRTKKSSCFLALSCIILGIVAKSVRGGKFMYTIHNPYSNESYIFQRYMMQNTYPKIQTCMQN